MGTYDKDKLRELLKDANELASEVPEESRKEILKSLIDHMLSLGRQEPSAIHIPATQQSDPPASATGSNTTGSKQGWEEAIFNGLPESHAVAEGNKNAQTIWAVIHLVKNGKSATVQLVRTIIKDLLGVSPESQSNTSTCLKDLVPKYLTREKVGKCYVYRPTRNALHVFKTEA